MADLNSSSRTLLGAIGVAPLVGSPSVVPGTPIAPSGAGINAAAWTEAWARCRTAEEAYTRMAERMEHVEDDEALRCAEIAPNGLREIHGWSVFDQLHHVDLEELGSLYEPPHTNAPFGSSKSLIDKVATYRRDRARIAAEIGLDAARAALDMTVAECHAAFAALLHTPPPTIAALADKLTEAAEHDLNDEDVLLLAGDARRLVGVA